MAIVQANKVVKSIDLVVNHISILKGCDLSVNAGESVAILGVSGSGKSTLLGVLAGLDDPSSGEVQLLGQALSPMSEEKRALLRHQIGFIFQNFHLLPHLTALENVMLACEIANIKGASEKATAVLKEVGLGERLNHYPSQLSGGEQQRVAVARAFVTSPTLIFADEPTGSLDENTGAQIIDLLFDLNKKRGTTLIIVTHDSALAKRAQYNYALEHGLLKKMA